MPNYNLRCTDCSSENTIRASMKEKAEKQIFCPECGSVELETVFSAAPAYVKGTKEFSCPNSRSCGSHCRSAS